MEKKLAKLENFGFRLLPEKLKIIQIMSHFWYLFRKYASLQLDETFQGYQPWTNQPLRKFFPGLHRYGGPLNRLL